MTFTPSPKRGVGGRIRLDRAFTTRDGTYSAGHEFTIIDDGHRGLSIRDDSGREVHEFDGPFSERVQYSAVDARESFTPR